MNKPKWREFELVYSGNYWWTDEIDYGEVPHIGARILAVEHAALVEAQREIASLVKALEPSEDTVESALGEIQHLKECEQHVGGIGKANSDLRIELSQLKSENDKLRAALESLVKKIDVIHDDELYKAVWSVAFVHGIDYTNGPNYVDELKRAREALTKGGE